MDCVIAIFCWQTHRGEQEWGVRPWELAASEGRAASLSSYFLANCGLSNPSQEGAPVLVGAPPRGPWDATASDRAALDYAAFIGDLTWLARCNPRLAFIAQGLAHFVNNPGPDHTAAAKGVLFAQILDGVTSLMGLMVC